MRLKSFLISNIAHALVLIKKLFSRINYLFRSSAGIFIPNYPLLQVFKQCIAGMALLILKP